MDNNCFKETEIVFQELSVSIANSNRTDILAINLISYMDKKVWIEYRVAPDIETDHPDSQWRVKDVCFNLEMSRSKYYYENNIDEDKIEVLEKSFVSLTGEKTDKDT